MDKSRDMAVLITALTIVFFLLLAGIFYGLYLKELYS